MSDADYWKKIGEQAAKDRAERERFAVGQGKTETERHESNCKKKLYACSGCKHEQFEPWLVRTRSARPRCPSCGSLSYHPKTESANKDIADLKDVRASYHKLKPGEGSGSFVVGGR